MASPDDLVGMLSRVRIRSEEDDIPILKAIDAELERLCREIGSMKKLKQLVNEHGVCLKNAKQYGSAIKLQTKLRHNRALLVRKEDAKEFKFAKQCLVTIA